VDSVQFDFVCRLVYDHTAIVLEPTKEYLIQARLSPIARAEGVATVEALVGQLRRDSWGPVHSRVVEAMTTNETSFFRDLGPFEALKRTVLPELLQRRAPAKRLSIWSAASSTGQEIYSIAMMLKETFPELANGWRLTLLATDFCTEMVERARAGVFNQLEVNRGLPAPLLVKYFKRNGGDWEIREDLRKMIEFRQLNLNDPWLGIDQVDVVFMRNVLIYFDVATKKRILGRLPRTMKADGVLFLGAAETTLGLEPAFQPVEIGKTICYRIRGGQTTGPV
jgi:chemotaxis protein methyltransferase CheR